MKAYVFPGQGAQFTGMGKDLFDNSEIAKSLFKQANDSLGFDITRIMFEGEKEELTQTKVTQPAIFLHSVILAKGIRKSIQSRYGRWSFFRRILCSCCCQLHDF